MSEIPLREKHGQKFSRFPTENIQTYPLMANSPSRSFFCLDEWILRTISLESAVGMPKTSENECDMLSLLVYGISFFWNLSSRGILYPSLKIVQTKTGDFW